MLKFTHNLTVKSLGYSIPRTTNTSQDREHHLHHSLNHLDEPTTRAHNWQCQHTWSPCSYCPPAEELYKRAVEAKGPGKMLRFSTIKQEARDRRLSSIFLPRNVESASVSAENFPNSPAAETAAPSQKMRFTVTPCALDKVNQ